MPMPRPFGALALCALLSACAHGADETAMIPAAIAPLPAGNPHRGAISGIETAGGKDTNPALASQIADADFKAALRSALLLSGAYSASGRYVLRAEIEEITQPLFGLDMQVGLTVRYRLQDRAGKTRWERRIVTRHTARLGESFLGSERLRYANEGAARENIAAFLRALGAEARAGGVADVS